MHRPESAGTRHPLYWGTDGLSRGTTATFLGPEPHNRPLDPLAGSSGSRGAPPQDDARRDERRHVSGGRLAYRAFEAASCGPRSRRQILSACATTIGTVARRMKRSSPIDQLSTYIRSSLR